MDDTKKSLLERDYKITIYQWLDYNNPTHSIGSWDATWRLLDGWERGLECSLTWLGATKGSVSRELSRQEVGNYSTNINIAA
jgi:hypothetical protein